MFEEEGDALEIGEEEYTEEDILLYSTYPGPRIIVLNSVGMSSTNEAGMVDPLNILGLVLDESEDSFLVGLPARMIDNNGTIVIKPFAPVPYLRLMKSAILSLMYPFGMIEGAYQEYLNTKGRELYPEIAEYIEEGEAQAEPEESVIASPVDMDIGLARDAGQDQEVLGMSDEELKQYLTDKYNNGGLSNGSGKKH